MSHGSSINHPIIKGQEGLVYTIRTDEARLEIHPDGVFQDLLYQGTCVSLACSH